MSRAATWRPEPSWGAVVGTALAGAGFFLPWFRGGFDYQWYLTGWRHGSLEEGGWWSVVTLAFLAGALVAGLYARRSREIAMFALAGAVAAAFLCALLVAASFASAAAGSEPAVELPASIGLPLLALGLGLAVAGSTGAVAAGEQRERR